MPDTNNTTTQKDAEVVSSSALLGWSPVSKKPNGTERKILLWIVWPESSWPTWPEPKIGWWKCGPECFCVDDIENADHLVTHWMDIKEPNAEVTGTRNP